MFSCNTIQFIVKIFERFSDMNILSCSLQQVDENRKAVTTEIKKSICNLIMEINRKGKILVNQLEVRPTGDVKH